ncbi:hypothetical protein NPIL_418611 [Nephila pilipes]|uniref:Uncharacterized protein n=1 Tax=Nephila pilipes TaxID=299642 RepID=A0A8X6MET4_NEPPI|nr:hypothetical protein NPIL_418611 [Nephila pilipes]
MSNFENSGLHYWTSKAAKAFASKPLEQASTELHNNEIYRHWKSSDSFVGKLYDSCFQKMWRVQDKTARGEDIAKAVQKCLEDNGIDTNKIVSIATDEAGKFHAAIYRTLTKFSNRGLETFENGAVGFHIHDSSKFVVSRMYFKDSSHVPGISSFLIK